MATRGSYSGSSKSPQQPKLGRPLQITKGSKRYRIDFGCSDWAREAYERWQKKIFLGVISFVNKVIPMQQCCFR